MCSVHRASSEGYCHSCREVKLASYDGSYAHVTFCLYLLFPAPPSNPCCPALLSVTRDDYLNTFDFLDKLADGLRTKMAT